MAKQIKTPEPGTELHYAGETYVSDDDGLVDVPDAAAKVFVESHGCVDPSSVHPYGLRVVDLGRDRFQVVGANGPVHSGYLPVNAAYALLKTWTPNDEEGDEASDKDAERQDREDNTLASKQTRGAKQGAKPLRKAAGE